MNRTVILVDEQNQPLGSADIITAHTGQGQLHRAFSVYVFRNDGNEILIQRRSKKKMLWPMIWANTCCSHPFEKESPEQAGERRLFEELGMHLTLKPAQQFVYRAEDPEKRGVEHEHVTILIGETGPDTEVKPNPDEVSEWKWVEVQELLSDMQKNPDTYAPWFHQGLKIILDQRPS